MEIQLSLVYGPKTGKLGKKGKGSMMTTSILKFNELILVTVLSCETEMSL